MFYCVVQLNKIQHNKIANKNTLIQPHLQFKSERSFGTIFWLLVRRILIIYVPEEKCVLSALLIWQSISGICLWSLFASVWNCGIRMQFASQFRPQSFDWQSTANQLDVSV